MKADPAELEARIEKDGRGKRTEDNVIYCIGIGECKGLALYPPCVLWEMRVRGSLIHGVETPRIPSREEIFIVGSSGSSV